MLKNAPWNWNERVVSPEGKATPQYLAWLQQQLTINRLTTDAVPQGRKILTGVGLDGGGDLTEDRTISLDAVLNDINDVSVSSPGDGQALVWDSATNLWIPKSVAASMAIKQAGTTVVNTATALNFSSGATVTDAGGGQADISISGGGGGSSHERTWTIPVASQFTLQNPGSGSTLCTLSDDANGNGVRITAPTTTSNIRFMTDTATLPTPPYTMIARFSQVTPEINSGSYLGILLVRNSSNGRIILWGNYRDGDSSSRLAQKWASYTGFAGNILPPVNIRQTPWWAFEVGTTVMSFLTSPDGWNWYRQATTETISTYVGTIDEIGTGVMVNGQPADTMINSYEIISGTL